MLGKPTLTRRAKYRESTRAEILDAAWEVARERGLPALTLREVTARVGMQAPSLYSHFDSKNAIYDAMFGQAWQEYQAAAEAHRQALPHEPRAALRSMAHHFFDFAVTDLARHQIMNRRTLVDFRPSPESYASAVAVLEGLRAVLIELGIHDPDATDMYTALVGGMVEQQWANDPGGDRWARLLDRVIDMYALEMGL